MWNNLEQKALYLIILAVVIALEHQTLSRKWRPYELARWTLGVATVVTLAIPIAIAGTLDLDTLAWLFIAFAVAGAVTSSLYLREWSNERETKAEILKSRIEEATSNDYQATGADSRQRAGLSRE